jgi:putative membrane protein
MLYSASMTGFLIRAVVCAVGLWVASYIVPGVTFSGAGALVLAAVLLGLANAVIRPIFFFLTLPLTLVTLGLFIFVVNGAMVGLVAWLMGEHMVLGGFWPAIFTAIVVGLTGWVASWFIGDKMKPHGIEPD